MTVPPVTGETLAVIHVDVQGHGPQIVQALLHNVPAGSRLYVLVPSEPDRPSSSARQDLASLVAQLQQAGRIADGRLGDTFVLDSVAALINDRTVDGIVVVTPPLGLPDRLHLDLGHRISRAFDLPTSHVVVPDTTWSGGLDLSIGAGSAVSRPQPLAAPDAYRVPIWAGRALPVVVVLLVIALVGTFVAGLHQTSVDNRKLLISETAAPTTFTALAGIPPTGGAIHEYPAFFPALIKIHAGDTIAFTNPTADVPHSVTFGVAPNHSNQPVFESGPAGPIPVVVAPCATDTPLTQQTRTCAAPSTAAALPPFSGQAFYSSGIIAPQQQFLLRTASTLAAGTYHYVCLIHANQTGTIVVEPRGTPTQLAQTLDDNAQKQQHHDASVLANLQPPVPRAGTVQAGVTGPETSLNQFFPASIQIRAGDSVTWTNNGGTPHVIIFDGYVDPNTATFSPPTAASGSDYTGGLFHTYLIGSPPYFSTTFALRFTQTGIYTYICSLHPGMGGTVIVHN